LSSGKTEQFDTYIHDSIHGTIGIYKEEMDIIDSKIFQRLRHISHLGTVSYVYPGATQTRFAHSIGTMYLMERVGRKFVEKEIISNEDLRKLRLTALLHDVGHFPFSHNLESPIQNAWRNYLNTEDGEKFKEKRVELYESNKAGNHEDFSRHLIMNSGLKDSFSQHKPDEISSILKKDASIKQSFYSLLISSDLDVDRMDYLLRDAHETGVAYGNIDLERIIHTIMFTRDDEDNTFIAVENKGKYALESFLLARYLMYQTVYYHKNASCYSKLLESIYESLLEKDKVYSYKTLLKLDDEDVYNFNDHYVWSSINQNEKEGEILSEYIRCFKYRVDMIVVRDIEGISIKMDTMGNFDQLSKIDNPDRKKRMAERAGIPPEWICYVQPKPLTIMSNPEDEKAVHIILDDGTSKPIANEKTSIINMLYENGYLSARLYTHNKYRKKLDETLDKEWGI